MTIAIGAIAPKVRQTAHIYRQVVATFAGSLLSLSAGVTFGFSAVLLPQLKTDPDYPYDPDFDSWIASISPLAMMMGSLFSGYMSDGLGRRMGQLVLIVPFVFGWIIMGVFTNNTGMLIGRFITGVCTGSVRANSMIYISELSTPKYRSSALFCPSAAIHIGVMFSHVVGKYCNWKLSCYIFTLPNIISFVILLFLKESPLWLLSKGKTDEGIESFRLFRGNGENSDKELAKILERQEVGEEKTPFRDILKIFIGKPFLKAITTIFLLFISSQWCGVNTISFYAERIFQKTFSGDIDAFMLMLVTDAIRIGAAVFMCIFANGSRKFTFQVTSVFTTLALVGLAIYLYLAPPGLVWVAITCMVIYVAMASALTSISWSFIAEIFPAKVRGFCSGLSSGVSFTLLFISVKMTPEIMDNYGDVVMYSFFASVTFITGIILSFMLPETNGRSLQDIEDSLYHNGDDKKSVNKKNESTDSVPDSPAVYVEKL